MTNKERAMSYLEKRVASDWLPVLEPFAERIYSTLARLFNSYPEKTQEGYRYKYKEGRHKAKVHLYPRTNDVLRAFRVTSYKDLQVVIVGQDPYFNHNLATGLAFGVPNDTPKDKIPASLLIILEELLLSRDWNLEGPAPSFMRKTVDIVYGKGPVQDGDVLDAEEIQGFDFSLQPWAEQGVLLLNSALTVEQKSPGSHEMIWFDLVKDIIDRIGELRSDVLFVALGNRAKIITDERFLQSALLTTYHPAYDARKRIKAFRGDYIFAKINKHLKQKGHDLIKWI
jgi:uracil-DNA glycosylase